MEIGYNSHSTFGKTFKKHFQISPAAFRKIRQKILRKFKPLSAISDKRSRFRAISLPTRTNEIFMENKANIQIKEMPEMQIASVLSIGVQNIGNAYNPLFLGQFLKYFP